MTKNQNELGRTPTLSRDMLVEGTVQKQARLRDGSHSTILSTDELRASRRTYIPDDYSGDDIWVFGYGSLIWNPLIDFKDRCDAHVFGFHKRFCLWTKIGRGTPECPGLVLALDYGGSVKGQAFRICSSKAATELDVLWKREMLNASYEPRWLTCKVGGSNIRALGFVIRHDSPAFASKMPDEAVADVIARASGFLGPCADYLFETERALSENGMKDSYLRRLCSMVSQRQSRAQ